MKTLAKLLYVEADEEVTDLVDRLRHLSGEEAVTFVVPDGARSLQSPMCFRVVMRYAEYYGKHVNVISGEPRVQALALESGFSVYPTLAAYDVGTEVHRPGAPVEPAVEPAVENVAEKAAEPASEEEPVPAGVRTATVVSAPPKGPLAPLPRLLEKKPPRDRRPYYIGAAVVAVVAFLVAILFVPTATVTISVTGQPIKTDLQLIGAPGTQVGSVDHFPTQLFTATESSTAQGTATGQNQVAAVQASGEVVFSLTNCPDCTEPIFKGVIVKTADGKLYATQKAVVVKANQAGSGSVTVNVTADAQTTSGAKGNTGLHTITVIVNQHPSELTVTNASDFTNGADARTATVIQQSDIDTVRQALLDQLNPKIQDDLTTQAKNLHLITQAQPDLQSTNDHKLGDEISNFNLTLTVKATGVAFDNAAVHKMLRDALQRKVPQGSELTTDNIKTAYDVADATKDGTVTLNGHAQGFTVLIFSQPAIRAHITGRTPTSSRVFLLTLPNVVDVVIRQDPIGLPWLPFFSSHINVHIQEVPGTVAS